MMDCTPKSGRCHSVCTLWCALNLKKQKQNIFINWKTVLGTKSCNFIYDINLWCPLLPQHSESCFNLCSVQFHLFTLYESDIFQSGEKFQLCCQFFLQQIWTYIYSIYIYIFIYKMENLPFPDWILIMQIQYVTLQGIYYRKQDPFTIHFTIFHFIIF